jgi:ELWxxDGT repeat protein
VDDPSQTPAASGNALCFRRKSNAGAELWKVDNTTGAASLVADLNPRSFDSNPTDMPGCEMISVSFWPACARRRWFDESPGWTSHAAYVVGFDPSA